MSWLPQGQNHIEPTHQPRGHLGKRLSTDVELTMSVVTPGHLVKPQASPGTQHCP